MTANYFLYIFRTWIWVRKFQFITKCHYRTSQSTIFTYSLFGTWTLMVTCQFMSCIIHFFVAKLCIHYCDVIMGAMASQLTSLTIVYATVYPDAYQRKHQSSASLAFVRRIHRWPLNSPRLLFDFKMTSWHENYFCITVPMWGEPVTAMWSSYKLPAIRDVMTLKLLSKHSDTLYH